jgi:hypothetical protein
MSDPLVNGKFRPNEPAGESIRWMYPDLGRSAYPWLRPEDAGRGAAASEVVHTASRM